MLRELLLEIKAEETDRIPEEKDIEHIFSDSFIKKTNKLIHKQKNNFPVYKMSKKIAVIILVIIMFLISALTVKTDALYRLFDFFYYLSENVLVVEKEGDEDDDNEPIICYTLPEIPDGFEEDRVSILKNSYDLIWMGPKVTSIRLTVSKNELNHHEYNKSSEYHTEKINSIDTLCIHTQKIITYVWEEDGYLYKLRYSDSLGKEFAEKCVGKLIKKEFDS